MRIGVVIVTLALTGCARYDCQDARWVVQNVNECLSEPSCTVTANQYHHFKRNKAKVEWCDRNGY